MSTNGTYAEELSSSDTHYLMGYQGYLERNYAVCADQFYLSNLEDSDVGNRARLLLAYCQERLGLKALAAYHVNHLSEDDFQREEKAIFNLLSKRLEADLSVYYRPYVWLFPYFGYGTFSQNSIKNSAMIYGAAGNISYRDWAITLGGEQVGLALKTTSSSYSQTQFASAVSKSFGDHWSLHANFTYLSCTQANLDQTWILGGGIDFTPWVGTTAAVEYDQSNYSNLLGGLVNNQINVSLQQVLWSNASSALTLKFLVESLLPTAPTTYDSSTQFTLKSNYERYALDVALVLSSWQLGVSGWSGSEAFGVRNQGALIYNALEEHHFGWTAKVGDRLANFITVQASVSQEGFLANGANSTATTLVGGVIANF